MDDPQGVPISAIIFGGRREHLVPLVFEARNWRHGVLVGAAMGSETTAAATGAVGVLRRDSMAMKPFCGYNYGDYFAHWLSFDKAGAKLPKIFHVNWFRKGADGKFLWPGFGDNMRVLEWIVGRCTGNEGAIETPIGLLPQPEDLNLAGLEVPAARLEALLHIDTEGWSPNTKASASTWRPTARACRRRCATSTAASRRCWPRRRKKRSRPGRRKGGQSRMWPVPRAAAV
jgi:phosphoenolpyruvate carboxykinase (GTP)